MTTKLKTTSVCVIPNSYWTVICVCVCVWSSALIEIPPCDATRNEAGVSRIPRHSTHLLFLSQSSTCSSKCYWEIPSRSLATEQTSSKRWPAPHERSRQIRKKTYEHFADDKLAPIVSHKRSPIQRFDHRTDLRHALIHSAATDRTI